MALFKTLFGKTGVAGFRKAVGIFIHFDLCYILVLNELMSRLYAIFYEKEMFFVSNKSDNHIYARLMMTYMRVIRTWMFVSQTQ